MNSQKQVVLDNGKALLALVLMEGKAESWSRKILEPL